ncbi:MraY family glycosyltransferase [Orrella marina]|uniref:MraY family glycosyltransferase n=1 Tax=Orrella marina TaxID=2163011 RepID=UPI00131F1600|nr:glycosyltransferase [Orrella marina]
MWELLIASGPALLFGLAEDLTKRVGTKERLLATMFSGVVAWYLTGYALFRVDVPGVDILLSYTLVAVLFTAFAIGGVANAINMIDGFNGLASGTVLVCLGAMGVMAWQVNDEEVLMLILIIGAATLGFFVVNFPFGRLFLGDGGAYALGFMVAWMAVMLSARHPEHISPWAPLLACAYPILEAVFSMGRRAMRGLAIDQPDRTHLHSLVYRRVIPRFFKTQNQALRNAAVSPFMWAFACLPALLSILFMSSTIACIAGLLFAALVYAHIYARLSHFRWTPARLRFRSRPSRQD